MPKVSEEHRVARRRQILGAAGRCFARQGLHRTSMQDVIEESGLSAGAIYSYFTGKREIFEAIADVRHEREAEAFAEALGAPDATDALGRLSDAFLGALADPDQRRERVVSIDLWAEAVRDERLRAIVRRGVDQPRAMFAERIRLAQQRGEAPSEVDPDALARIIVAVFYGFVLQQAWDADADVQAYVDATRVLARALLSG